MAGAYCQYCDHRCFVYRLVPGTHITHLATCSEGMAHDRAVLGVDHTTAINPLRNDLVDNLVDNSEVTR